MIQKIFLLFTVTVALIGCSPRTNPSGTGTSKIFYPPPPDTARIQFLKKISNSNDVIGKEGWFKKFILGSDEVRHIGKPYGVAVNKGKIYICDTFKRGIDIIDLEKNSFQEFVPSGQGALKLPLNCFLDDDGYLYIADADRKQVVVYTPELDYYFSFGEKENFKPTDVFIAGNLIWVVNVTGHQVHVYSKYPAFSLVKKFPLAAKDSVGYLFSPTNIFIADNLVYVTDFGDFKIKKYTLDGKYKDAVGTYGENIGQFARPKGIAVDHQANLYAVDAGFENVQLFNKEGRLLMFFGGNYKGPGDLWLPAKVTIDYDNTKFFEPYVDNGFKLIYLILVTSQFGPDKLNIYGYVEKIVKEGQQ